MIFEMCLFSMAPHPKGTSSGDALRPRQGAARRAHGSSAEHAMRDLIASNAPLRARRKSPWGKAVRTKHVRILQNINPRGFKGAANRGPRQSPTKWVWWGEEEQRND